MGPVVALIFVSSNRGTRMFITFVSKLDTILNRRSKRTIRASHDYPSPSGLLTDAYEINRRRRLSSIRPPAHNVSIYKQRSPSRARMPHIFITQRSETGLQAKFCDYRNSRAE